MSEKYVESIITPLSDGTTNKQKYIIRDKEGRELISELTNNLSESVADINEELNKKVDKISGKGLSTNDYTTTEKNKLANIESGAEVNVQSDWSVTNSSSDAYIKNKPTIDTAMSSTSINAVQNKVINTALGGKVDKVTGKGLSTNDYTTQEKNKLAAIAAGAEVNVNADWNANSGDAQILNKPFIPSAISDLTNDSGFITSADVPIASTTSPKMDGTAAVGTETKWARGDHVHPSDSTKVDKVTGKGLSTNDYTTAEKNKLAGIATGAEVNVNADWNATSGDAQILNKPTTISGYGITDAYTKIQVDSLVSGVLHYKGTKATVSALPTSGNKTGDVWHITADGSEHAWDGSVWQELGTSIDLSAYYTSSQVDGLLNNKVTIEAGKGLSTNDYTTTEKNKLAGISAGAQVNVQADWNTTATSADSFIKNKPSIPSKTSDLTNDSGFITSADIPEGAAASTTVPKMDGTAAIGTELAFARGDHVHPTDTTRASTATFSTSANGLVPHPTSASTASLLNSSGTWTTLPSSVSEFTNDAGYITGMTILSYGQSTLQDFLDAYQANKVVYARVSSDANPASGDQTRLAFMAYVNNTTTPSCVEFQYYRSINTHTSTQQGDQVFVYTLKNTGWTVTTREASVKVVAGSNMVSTYSNNTITLNVNTFSTSANGVVPKPSSASTNSYLNSCGTWTTPPNTTYGTVTTAANGLMTATDKIKLNAMSTVDNNSTYSLTQNSSDGHKLIWTVNGGTPTTFTIPDNNTTYDLSTITGTLSIAKGGTGATNAANARTNLQAASTAIATTAANGLMSAVDKIKLNALSTVSQSGTLSGTTGTGNYKVVLSKTASTATIPAASTSAAGVMTTAQVNKLNGIAAGANNYTHPSYTATTGAPTANQSPGFGGTFSVNQVNRDATGHIGSLTNRTITIPSAVVTTAANGLMSSADKTLLTSLQNNSITDMDFDGQNESNGYKIIVQTDSLNDPIEEIMIPQASTATHGVVKPDGTASHYLNGTGGWTAPPNATYTLTGTTSTSNYKVVLSGANAATATIPLATSARAGVVKPDGTVTHFLNGTGGWTAIENNTFPIGTILATTVDTAPSTIGTWKKIYDISEFCDDILINGHFTGGSQQSEHNFFGYYSTGDGFIFGVNVPFIREAMMLNDYSFSTVDTTATQGEMYMDVDTQPTIRVYTVEGQSTLALGTGDELRFKVRSVQGDNVIVQTGPLTTETHTANYGSNIGLRPSLLPPTKTPVTFMIKSNGAYTFYFPDLEYYRWQRIS